MGMVAYLIQWIWGADYVFDIYFLLTVTVMSPVPEFDLFSWDKESRVISNQFF